MRAGGEDGAALVGRQLPGLPPACVGVGNFGTVEVFEGLASQRPVGRALAGVAGGSSDGGDGHGGGRRRPAGRAKMPDVGGEARVVERAAVEPSGQLAVCRRVGTAGIRRGTGLAELDRLLGADALGIGGEAVVGLRKASMSCTIDYIRQRHRACRRDH